MQLLQKKVLEVIHSNIPSILSAFKYFSNFRHGVKRAWTRNSASPSGMSLSLQTLRWRPGRRRVQPRPPWSEKHLLVSSGSNKTILSSYPRPACCWRYQGKNMSWSVGVYEEFHFTILCWGALRTTSSQEVYMYVTRMTYF